jgi:predicted DNA-binding helix-hairpin-helix protein
MNSNIPRSALTPEEVRKVAPALEHYTRNIIEEGLWKRPELSTRDRSIVTASALIARNQTIGVVQCLRRRGHREGHLHTARHRGRSASVSVA